MSVTLSGNGGFADVIKLRSLSTRVGPNAGWLVFLREEKTVRKCLVKAQTHRGTMPTWRWRQGLKLRCHKPRDAWGLGLLEDGEDEPSKGAGSCQDHDSELLVSRTLREHISVVLRHSNCGYFIMQTKTAAKILPAFPG